MKYSEGSLGRVFVLQLEDGDPINAAVERFAREHEVERGIAFYVGGGAPGTSLVVGPDTARSDAVVPLFHALAAPHETFAVGTLFPNDAGRPVLHMHAACGREGEATVGCTRAGLEAWLTGEIVLVEIAGAAGRRTRDAATGFELLDLSQHPAPETTWIEGQRTRGQPATGSANDSSTTARPKTSGANCAQ